MADMNRKATTVSDIALAMNSAGVGARNHQMKTEMAKWVTNMAKQMKNPWSVVLTYKAPDADSMPVAKERMPYAVPTAKELAGMERWLRKHFSKLVHDLSGKAYRNAGNRHKKLVKSVAFFELGNNGRFHIHAIFDVPAHTNPAKSYHEKFGADVHALWKKHGKVIEAKKVVGDKARNQSDEEALTALCLYMVKLRTKYTASGSYTDALLLVE